MIIFPIHSAKNFFIYIMNNKPFEINFSYALQWWTARVAADFQLVLTHQNNFSYTFQLFRTVWTPKYVEITGEWNPCFVTRFTAVKVCGENNWNLVQLF